MSFMSFDYAMRAADAALQFQQSQGQNIKDTNARGREVGTGNAKRKDDLVRQKIEAEYAAKSAEIKMDKAEKLADLADKRKQSAMMTQMMVGIGTLAGGMLDGLVDAFKKDPTEVPDSAQMGIGQGAIDAGYASSFRIAAGTGNSEQGAVVSYDPNQGTFSMVGMNTTTGQVQGFVQMSATDMAQHILDTTATSTDPMAGQLRSMIDQGPPAMFKQDFFTSGEHGEHEMQPALREALFGGQGGDPAGFFAQGSRVRTADGSRVGDDAGEQMVAGLLRDPAAINSSYAPTADAVMRLLETDGIRNGLQISPETVGKAGKGFEDAGITLGSGWRGLNSVGDGFQKIFFKPLGTALPQFMELAKVSKQYAEEYEQKMVEYEEAKKQAAAAYEKLQKLESLLEAGSSA